MCLFIILIQSVDEGQLVQVLKNTFVLILSTLRLCRKTLLELKVIKTKVKMTSRLPRDGLCPSPPPCSLPSSPPRIYRPTDIFSNIACRLTYDLYFFFNNCPGLKWITAMWSISNINHISLEVWGKASRAGGVPVVSSPHAVLSVILQWVPYISKVTFWFKRAAGATAFTMIKSATLQSARERRQNSTCLFPFRAQFLSMSHCPWLSH